MTQQYEKLINLLSRFEYKINELSSFRIFNSEYSKIIENSQLCILEKHLEKELIGLADMFEVSKKSAIVLCAMFFNSFLHTEGLVSRIVSGEDLALSVCLEPHIILDLENEISELESKNILKINSSDHSIDRIYELTNSFINTIINP